MYTVQPANNDDRFFDLFIVIYCIATLFDFFLLRSTKRLDCEFFFNSLLSSQDFCFQLYFLDYRKPGIFLFSSILNKR